MLRRFIQLFLNVLKRSVEFDCGNVCFRVARDDSSGSTLATLTFTGGPSANNGYDSGLDTDRDGTIGLLDFAAFRAGFGTWQSRTDTASNCG